MGAAGARTGAMRRNKMPKDGRLFDILVEDHIAYNPVTDSTRFVGFIVWANGDVKDIILPVPGVACIITKPDNPNRYVVMLDPRYDPQWVGAEIEAQLRIHAPIDDGEIK